jgi:hypothetical protein
MFDTKEFTKGLVERKRKSLLIFVKIIKLKTIGLLLQMHNTRCI